MQCCICEIFVEYVLNLLQFARKYDKIRKTNYLKKGPFL